MLAVTPEGWKRIDLPDVRTHARHGDEGAVEEIREALASGERLFLICTEGVAESNCFMSATDHISLFGGSPLRGDNRDDLGPRFPALMNLYLVPESDSWETGIVGDVPDWRLATPAEMNLLGACALVSTGVEEAEVAGHGGGKVMLLVRCHGWDAVNGMSPPADEAAEAAIRLYNSNFTEGGEEQ